MKPVVQDGMRKIERFFSGTFPRSFTVEIFSSRAAFDERLKRELGGETPQRWMVAMGVSKGVVLLSPRLWKTDADEHDGSDAAHVRDIVVHELVHVYHAQMNPSRDFEGMDELGWLVEGLAVYVSGQLDRSHREAAARAIAEGKAPARLANAWSGKYRYGVCGSLVAYLDSALGRDRLKRLLPITEPSKALAILEMSEEAFLRQWKEWIAKESHAAGVEPGHKKGGGSGP